MAPADHQASSSRVVWRIGAAFGFTAVSLATFVWSVAWNVSIGEHASDTFANGGNNAAWICFFGALMALVVSITLLLPAIDRRHSTS